MARKKKSGSRSAKRTSARPATFYITNPHLLTPKSARKYLTPKEARAVYSQLRSLAIQRLRRFEGTRYTQSRTYKYNVNRYPTLRELEPENLYHAIVDLRAFLSSKRSTLRGIKKAELLSLETLHRHGFTYVNEANFYEFGYFMEFMRSSTISKFFDSVRAGELYRTMQQDTNSPGMDELADEFQDYLDSI